MSWFLQYAVLGLIIQLHVFIPEGNIQYTGMPYAACIGSWMQYEGYYFH